MANKMQVAIPFSKFKLEIAKVLEKEKFVNKISKESSSLTIELLYENHKPKITQIKRVSKPGLRVYVRGKNIKRIKGGKGKIIISTPDGLMTGEEAKTKKLGGEVICQIW